VIVILMNCCG